jgi:2-C-methyl-D-erythritol 2,4-cyclodiphosphate synthase
MGNDTRIGVGYDIHRLEAGRPLILGGVQIPHGVGLLGHSDADVVCHALTDAMLGALARGDIGVHYPPSDPKWKNANSIELMKGVWSKICAEGWRLVNADVTITAEAPRLKPFTQAMRRALAEALGAAVERISVKATTTDGLGPEGEGRAISALAVCLVARADA